MSRHSYFNAHPWLGGFKPAIIHSIAAMALEFLPPPPSLMAPSPPPSTIGETFNQSMISTAASTTSVTIHASAARGGTEEPSIRHQPQFGASRMLLIGCHPMSHMSPGSLIPSFLYRRYIEIRVLFSIGDFCPT